MSNKDKFLKLITVTDKAFQKQLRTRVSNAEMLKESKRISMKILIRIDDLGWKQKDLAEQLNVSPQQVSKMLKGEENFTLDTLVKLQQILGIPLLASALEHEVSDYKVVAECKQNVRSIGVVPGTFTYKAESRWFTKKLKPDQELESGKNLIT